MQSFLSIISRITLGQRLSAGDEAALSAAIAEVLNESMRRILLPPGVGRAAAAVVGFR